jgi:hypothetical protein
MLGICALVLVLLGSPSTVHAGGSHGHQLGWIPTRLPYKGNIVECLAGDEFDLDSKKRVEEGRERERGSLANP